MKSKSEPGKLVFNPLFVGWVRDSHCGWLAACSSDSRADCHQLLYSAGGGKETVVLPMGMWPEQRGER